MGLFFRKRIKLGKGVGINLSRSGASVSVRGKRGSLNSRGRGSLRLGRGVSWRF